MVWCGVVWCGVVWCGVVWCGVEWYNVVFVIRLMVFFMCCVLGGLWCGRCGGCCSS